MKELLQKKNIKITDTRKEILRILSESKSAVSYNTIKEKTKLKLDKVTIYRTLETFEKKGIIHSIPSGEGIKLYSFCKDQCADHKHEDNHVHFKCEVCGDVSCLYDIVIPKIQLPEKFTMKSSKLIVNGTCNQCQ